MTPDDALAVLDLVLPQDSLNDAQELVFRQILEGVTYEQMTEVLPYDVDYIKHVGSKLLLSLSDALGQKVTKSNCRSILRRLRQGATTEGSHSTSITVTAQNPTSSDTHNQNVDVFKSNIVLELKPSQKLANTSKQDWGKAADVSIFYGREQELALLKQWAIQDKCRLIILFGIFGIGKTALAVKLAKQIQSHFKFVIWRSLRNALPLETLLSDLLGSVYNSREPQADIAGLIHHLRSSRSLLVLDNIETILDPHTAGKYKPGYEGYGELFKVIGETDHSSCLILTSREKLADVAPLEGTNLSVRSLRLVSGPNEASPLLKEKELVGSSSQKQTLCEYYDNNPLMLKIVATFIQDILDGETDLFLQKNMMLVSGIRRLIEQQFIHLSILEENVMYMIAINGGAMTLAQLEESTTLTLLRSHLLEALENLWGRCLIENQSGRYIQQPAIAAYTTEHFIEKICEDITSGRTDLLTNYDLFKDVDKETLDLLVFRLYKTLKSRKTLEAKLSQILVNLKAEPFIVSKYGTSNLNSLLNHVKSMN